ncbi:MAG: phage tail protein [Anaerolineaceae bacterium]|jgi:phage tail-like protein|nr:phage tail protein [Anaerolineaceae bacterium]
MALDQKIHAAITSAFRFIVSIDNTAVAAFTECTLPELELEIETVKEGGLNTFVHQLPSAIKPNKLILKNGVGVASEMQDWYLETMSGQFTRKPISVSLLNSMQKPVMTVDIEDAFPVKWTGPQLKTDENTIAIQTLEFVCGEISIVYS